MQTVAAFVNSGKRGRDSIVAGDASRGFADDGLLGSGGTEVDSLSVSSEKSTVKRIGRAYLSLLLAGRCEEITIRAAEQLLHMRLYT